MRRIIASPLPIMIVAVLMRLVPHPANFAPVAALALFSGAYLPKRYALIFPFTAMLISDLFLGYHSTILWVYGSFLLIGLLGMRLRSNTNAMNVFFTTVCSSLLFYFVTNVGVWITTDMYAKTWDGLIECYVMGLPFLRNTLAGDMTYTAAFFGFFSVSNTSFAKKHVSVSLVP